MFISRKKYEQQQEKIRTLTKEVIDDEARLKIGIKIINEAFECLEKMDITDENVRATKFNLVQCAALLGKQEEYFLNKLKEKIIETERAN